MISPPSPLCVFTLALALQTQCEVLEASQQLVRAERLHGGWAGP